MGAFSFIQHGSPSLGSGFATLAQSSSSYLEADAAIFSNPAEQGWCAMRVRFRWAGNVDANVRRLFSWRDGNNAGCEGLFDGSVDQIQVATVFPPGASDGGGQSYTAAAETNHTVIFKWSVATAQLSIDGAAFTGGGRRSVPYIFVPTFAIFRYQDSNVQYADGDIYWMLCGRGTLADADATTLNGLGDTDPTFATLGANAQTSMLATFDDFTYDMLPATRPYRPARMPLGV